MYIPGACVERVGVYEQGRGRDAGGGRDADGGRDVGRGSDLGRGSALRAPCSSAACAQVLVAAEHASGFAHLPDCSPAPYGSLAMCL